MPQNQNSNEDDLCKLRSLLAFINDKVNNLSTSTNDRNLTAGPLLSATIDHLMGFSILSEHKLFSPANALMRTIIETFIRAAWLKNCATEDEILKFRTKDKILDRNNKEVWVTTLIEAVENKKEWSGFLKMIKGNLWKVFNSYTHGGTMQILDSHDENSIGSSSDPNQQAVLIKICGVISVLSFHEIVEMSLTTDSEQLFKEIEPLGSWAIS